MPEWYPCLGDLSRFLSPASENQWISALEAKDASAGPGELDQAKGNIALPGRGLAAALAGKFDLGAGPGPAEKSGFTSAS